MPVNLFGNPDLKKDSLPLRLLPELQKMFPEETFTVLDPNEEWEIPGDFVAIDTVVGIDRVTVFEGLGHFADSPRVSLHDFDIFFNLRYLQKLGKLKKITIIGVPPDISPEQALEELTKGIKSYNSSRDKGVLQ